MDTQLKKIGNSKGIIIPAAIIKTLGLKDGETFNVEIDQSRIILSKQDPFNPKSLEALFEGYEGDYKEKIVFEDKKGKEEW